MQVAKTLRSSADAPPSRCGNGFAERSRVHAAPVPIAVVLTSFESGGTERQMIELIRRLPADRWTTHVACLHARGSWHGRVAEAAASVAEFPIRSFKRPDTCLQGLAFARWCIQHDIAVVHTADLYANIFALPSAAWARVPVRVGNRRGLYFELSRAHLAMQRAAYSCAHAVIANSQATAAQLRNERVVDRKVTVVPNGLDVEAFVPAPAVDRRRRVITVANLRAVKGHDVLLDAATRVLQRFPDAHFTLVGEGPERPAIEALIARSGVPAAFSLLGERSDVDRLLAGSHIAVLPSRTESLPNALLEAMAARLPVVATNVGGVPEVVTHDRTGLLVRSGDAEDMAHQICRLMSEPLLGAQLGEAARAHVQQHFSYDRMVSAIEGLYLRTLGRRAAVHAREAA